MNDIYRINISLPHVKPPVWRQIEVTADTDLGELHEIIQIAMGWEHKLKIEKVQAAEPETT